MPFPSKIITKCLAPPAALLACAAVIVASIAAFSPFWGLMDDAYLALELVPRLAEAGIWEGVREFVAKDIHWGMFRPLYPLMAYVLYFPGIVIAPWATFALNALFSILLLAWASRIFSRFLRISWVECLLFNAAFYYQYDLLQHPSLQEKLVLFCGLLFLACVSRPSWRWWFASLLALAMGFSAKASFAIFFAAGYFVLSAREWPGLRAGRADAWARVVSVVALGGLGIFLLARIATGGMYTAANYDPRNILSTLLSAKAAILWGPLLFAAWMFWRQRAAMRPEAFVPSAGVFFFLLLFLPWGLSGYLLSLVGPLYAAMCCQLARYYFGSDRLRPVMLAAVGVFAVAICSYRVPTMFLRLHDLGKIVSGWNEVVPPGERVFMPCLEGAESMEKFVRQAGAGAARVSYQAGMPAGQGALWLFDGSMCGLPSRAMEIPGCAQEPLYRSPWSRGYRLVRLSCL